MKNNTFSCITILSLLVTLVLPVALVAPSSPARTSVSLPALRSMQLRLSEASARLPLSFEANAGQTEDRVDFLSRGSSYTLFLTPTEAVFMLRNETSAVPQMESEHPQSMMSNSKSDVVRMRLVGANPEPEGVGLDQLSTKSHYFLGNDPQKWRTNIPHYAKVRYQDVYPGIDLVYYGNQRQLEYDFIIAPGADPRTIRLEYEGVEKLEVDAGGDLLLHTVSGPVRQRKPLVYQEAEGVRREIAGGYVLKDGHQVGFELGPYDAARPLVIDPVLVYSTYLGGSDFDQGLGITVDVEGNVYVTGATVSPDFPTENPLQPDYGGRTDAFVAKLSADGSELISSTYLGGSGSEWSLRIARDAGGNVYVAGWTSSGDFPTTPGAFQASLGGSLDAFVTKLNADGSALVYSTYLGGSGGEGTFFDASFFGLMGIGLAVDAHGNAYVRGDTNSPDFPTTPGAFQRAFGGGRDVFVAKLNADGSALAYSTYLGGNGDDFSFNIAVDSTGDVYVTGNTFSFDFPMANPMQPTLSGSALFKSTDAGSTWSATNTGLTGSIVQALAIDPITPTTLYAGTNCGIFKSTDGGSTWSASDLAGTEILSLAIDPITPSTLYAGTDRGIFKTTDAGDSWSGSGPANTNVRALAIDPTTPTTLYAGTDTSGIFKTTDAGDSWRAINEGLGSLIVPALVIDPITPSTLYAGTDRGVFKTTDAGDSWSKTRVRRPVLALAIDPTTPTTLYAGTSTSGVLKSTDGGERWRAINRGLGSPRIPALVIDPITPSTLYAGTDRGVFKTTDAGDSWSGSGPANTNVRALAIDPTTPSILYEGTTVRPDAFVAKLTADGSALVYSTYLGGNGDDVGRDIAVDVDGNAYVIGDTNSPDFPTANPLQPALNGSGPDAFVAKLTADGSALVYSTYLGGSSGELGFGIAVDADGNAYVTGGTISTDFPTANPLQPAFGGGGIDAFVTKLNATGSELIYSTYLGGSDRDAGFSIAVDATGNAYVTGRTRSPNFPTVNPAQPAFAGGGSDVFVTKIAESLP